MPGCTPELISSSSSYWQTAALVIVHDDMNPRRRVKGPGLQDVLGRVPSRGGTFGVVISLLANGIWILKNSIADNKIVALAKGRDLYLGR
jgi:hypothetical protein